ncbi:hypothetical protein J8273_3617 [Carpediemonas membranifera]|uniref:Uncharacterized protein n=1 Tax=Carpediemonas membranifera TaxID=201153 RepID=A0A8J6BAS3_9EUKA|nr:hypothetical protein J8273_3617 [Carpediemonas membranifera]|eukprot:KAG9393477.1 hypothetical protein J8273_3617 [Carpediemonas membranifera]
MASGNKSAVELMNEYDKKFSNFKKAGKQHKDIKSLILSKWGLAGLVLIIVIILAVILLIIFLVAYLRLFSFLPSIMTLFN